MHVHDRNPKDIYLLATATRSIPSPPTALYTVHRLHLNHLTTCIARTTCDIVIVSTLNLPVLYKARKE